MGPELFDAEKALLVSAVPSTVTVHDTDASHVSSDDVNYPFVVLSGEVPRQYGDAVWACRDEGTALVRGMHTALSPGAVRTLPRSRTSVLEGASPVVAGWHGLDLEIEDSSGVDVDRDVKILSNTSAAHPFYAVDIYRVHVTR